MEKLEENLNTDDLIEDDDDIEFDDNIDTDILQAQLQSIQFNPNMTPAEEAKLKEVNVDNIENQLSLKMELSTIDFETDKKTFQLEEMEKVIETEQQALVEVEKEKTEIVPILSEMVKLEDISAKVTLEDEHRSKKYIFYVDDENIDFIETLNLNERRTLINKILREQDELSQKNKLFEEKKQFAINVFIAILTIIFSFPLMFMFLNKAIALTLVNYQESQQNFEKLYREQGKIQNYKNFQNNF